MRVRVRVRVAQPPYFAASPASTFLSRGSFQQRSDTGSFLAEAVNYSEAPATNGSDKYPASSR